MFVRRKRVRSGQGTLTYVQLVENNRRDGKVRQKVLLTVGREDRLPPGRVDAIVGALRDWTERALVPGCPLHRGSADAERIRATTSLVPGRRGQARPGSRHALRRRRQSSARRGYGPTSRPRPTSAGWRERASAMTGAGAESSARRASTRRAPTPIVTSSSAPLPPVRGFLATARALP